MEEHAPGPIHVQRISVCVLVHSCFALSMSLAFLDSRPETSIGYIGIQLALHRT